jgi:Ca2+-binding RTX toxin-like protein
MAFPPIPNDILAAEPALRSELENVIQSLVDASELVTLPTGGNDQLFGTALDNLINGLAGNDVIAALGGNDNVIGGFGDDYVQAGGGNDTVVGGDGNDILFGQGGLDRMSGGDGDDAIFGGAGADTMDGGDGNDWLFGNAGSDRMTDNAGDDLLDGGDGNDNISSGIGNDELIGGAGNDILSAGADNDILTGGAGADRMSGGIGDDVYLYASRFDGNDRILDFASSQDRFEFVGLGFGVDPGTNLEDGTTFIANAAPTAVVAEATVLYETDTGRLWFDIDGTGAQAANLIATMAGRPQIDAEDFIFV